MKSKVTVVYEMEDSDAQHLIEGVKTRQVMGGTGAIVACYQDDAMEERDEALSQLAALREELDKAKVWASQYAELESVFHSERDIWNRESTANSKAQGDLQQRLADAERRNSALTAELEVANINAAHWKATVAGEGQVSKEARRYRGIRDVLPLNELLEVTKDCQSAADWDAAVDTALNKTEEAKS